MAGVRRTLMGVGACAVLASCSTGGVTNLSSTGVTLGGTVQTAAQPASYLFQYATDPAALGTEVGAVTPRRQLAANTASKAITEPVTGLTPATTYSYRLCGRIAGGESDGCLATRRFTTPPTGSRSITFDTPGSHTFAVPAGATDVSALVVGAGGGEGFSTAKSLSAGVPFGTAGGKGGSVQAPLPGVVAGRTLKIRVGGRGGDALVVGSIFPGAGGAGGTNGTQRGGSGGSGNNVQLPAEIIRKTGAGGGGGGAPSAVRQLFKGSDVFSDLPDQELDTLVAGGGGGGGGVTATSDDARGGDGGNPGGDGLDGARTNAADPWSLGGQGGGRGTVPAAGGKGGGKPADGSNGGQGGSDTTVVPPVACEADSRFGGGGGGGGWNGGGGGGSGRFQVIASPQPCGFYRLSVLIDGASGGGGGSSYIFATPGQPVFNTGVNSGDGYVTITWKGPAAG